MASKIVLKIALGVVESYAEKLGERKSISTLLKTLKEDEANTPEPKFEKPNPYKFRSGGTSGRVGSRFMAHAE